MAFFSASISTPHRAAEPAALRRIFIAQKAPRSPPAFIPPSLEARRRKIAASAAAATSFCVEQRFQLCWSNADFSLTRPRQNSLRLLLTGKNSPRKLPGASQIAQPSLLVPLLQINHQKLTLACSLSSISGSSGNQQRVVTAVIPPQIRKSPPALRKKALALKKRQ